ncbi:hypothetical protein BDV25DRAFT_167832 [Aspergillus avenaceus]|uniref:Uncharacterized protein n=1 Tax=Aspergillus avenaceus TaxID=36643 RepID=A0A5N6U6D6_ASPAV|nr:hypothetical protein BDV25DRAFT_167832 [Aspergillus avenaceus]
MRPNRTISIVGCHYAGDIGDMAVGGVLDPPNCNTMYDRLFYFQKQSDDIRELLMNEPWGQSAVRLRLVLPPGNPQTDARFSIMGSDEYPSMSGGNTRCTTTLLLGTRMVKINKSVAELTLDTLTGLFVAFDNVPAYVCKHDLGVDAPGLVRVDVALGELHHGIVDAQSIGLKTSNVNGPKLNELGEQIRKAVRDTYGPVHPENDDIRGATSIQLTGVVAASAGWHEVGDQYSGLVSRKSQLQIGERFLHESIVGTTFTCHLQNTATVGPHDVVLPTVQGKCLDHWLQTDDVRSIGSIPGGFWSRGPMKCLMITLR